MVVRCILVQADELSGLVVTAGEEVCSGAARRAKLRSAASAAVRVLELEDKDIGPELFTLLNQVCVRNKQNPR